MANFLSALRAVFALVAEVALVLVLVLVVLLEAVVLLKVAVLVVFQVVDFLRLLLVLVRSLFLEWAALTVVLHFAMLKWFQRTVVSLECLFVVLGFVSILAVFLVRVVQVVLEVLLLMPALVPC